MRAMLPDGAWDCHTHIYGPWEQFALPAGAAYRPEEAPFAQLRTMHARLRIAHGVLVQAACYGTDHSALLHALAAGDGRYRGTALIDATTSDAQIRTLHDAGVRGIRFNLMGHLPGQRDPAQLKGIAKRVASLGWHVLLHGSIQDLLPAFDALGDTGVPLVIDHMARQDGTRPRPEAEVRFLEERLASEHCWIKLSGVDRMMGGTPPPWNDAVPIARHLLACARARTIWGTDWPHPNIVGAVPDDQALLDFILEVCADDATAQAVLVQNPQRLYC